MNYTDVYTQIDKKPYKIVELYEKNNKYTWEKIDPSKGISKIQNNSLTRKRIHHSKINERTLFNLKVVKTNTIDSTLVPRLPERYREVEYIGSTGTQFIDTEFIPSNNTRTIVSTELLPSTDSKYLFGARESSYVGNYSFQVASNLYYSKFGTADLSLNYTPSKYPILIDKNKQVCHIDDQFLDNTNVTFTSPVSMYIFACNNNGALYAPCTAKIYYCKIYENDSLIRDYVPCIDTQLGVAGFYDLVDNRFYENKGTGLFIYGNDAIKGVRVSKNLPEEYQEVEYIESTGTQHIDTKLIPMEVMHIAMKATPISVANATTSAGFIPYGAGEATDISAFECFSWNNQYEFNFSNQHNFLGTATINDIVYIDQNRNIATITQNDIQNSATFTETSFTAPYSLTLFGLHRSSFSKGQQRVHSCQIYIKDVLQRDYVPCYYKKDGTIGLYDLVENKFYSNDGTGVFLKGPEVGVKYEIKDAGPYRVPIDIVGTLTPSLTQTMTNAASIFFDGQSYIKIKLNTLGWDLNKDWTVEYWDNLNVASDSSNIISIQTYPITMGFGLGASSAAGKERIFSSDTTSNYNHIPITSSGEQVINTWGHWAWVYDATNRTISCYKNGKFISGAVGTADFLPGNIDVYIGSRSWGSIGNITGYLEDLTISQYQKYTEDFEPPMEIGPYPDEYDENTLLLLNGGTGADDPYPHAFKNLPAPINIPTTSAGVNMQALGYTKCYQFTNTGGANPCTFQILDTTFTEGNFCIEWWELPTVAATSQVAHSQRIGLNTQGSTYQGILLGYGPSGLIYASNSNSGWDIYNGVSQSNGWSSSPTTEWTHFALDKKGIKWYLYKNGVCVWQGTNNTGTHPINKGMWYLGFNFQGYITGLRISKTSRYIDPWYKTNISKPEYAHIINDGLLLENQTVQQYYDVASTVDIPGFGVDIVSNSNPQPADLMGCVMWWAVDDTTTAGIKRSSVTSLTDHIAHSYVQTGAPAGTMSTLNNPICAHASGHTKCVELSAIGAAGHGMYFQNASDAVISCSTIFNNNDWTLEYWEYRKSTDPVGSAAMIIGTDTNRTTDYGGIKLGYNDGSGNQRVLFSTNGTSWNSSNVLFGKNLQDQWVHRAFVAHGALCYCYENGKISNITTRPTWGFYSDSRIHIGCGGIHGSIPYLAFWKGARWTTDFTPKKEFFTNE